MCTLAVYYRTLATLPLVVAANRDEYFDRPATEPGRLSERPVAFGGRDLRAGGTWLGLNAHGLIAALLNRRSAEPLDNSRRSRGLLCLEILGYEGVEAAIDALARVEGCQYNPFNLLVASRGASAVATGNGREINLRRMEPGLHVLTNLDLDDPTCPRIGQSFERFCEAGRAFERTRDRAQFLRDLHRILSDHEIPADPRSRGPLDALCVHFGSFGTRSSSVIFVGEEEGDFEYFHAPGPPCCTPFSPLPLPF